MKKLVFLLLFIISGCTKVPFEEGFVEPYFCPTNNCEDIMIRYLSNATSVKCAFYDLNLEKLTAVLKNKEAEVLIFEDNYEGFGTAVKSKGLMHNKFCILDENLIFTGSFNPTINGNSKNNNNIVIIQSKVLAENYRREFQELKTGVNRKTKNKKIIFNGFLVENYFCPDDGCQREVLEELKSANESIYFMTFSFTDQNIAELLVEKSKQINVRGVVEKQRINMQYEVFHYLNDSSINVVLDNNPAIMHHKVFIIDNTTVITGSYNPTKSGNERNDENILIIHDEYIAKQFLKEFNQLTILE
ncbi:MAG: hypothetical protein KJ583_02390 [Nanoarchaeota archaeon]|nr:hypothetical protein [Nanoarchaeota archaeon]MBU1269903.1 hypothetical protein [Nanoarchaeota archaeon]MBU1604144.1 hypothetical protein [Nanoarchaeota archaeon]MBU2443266.1 hypothetical protein [Nanoarchaeota archaeon]